MQSNWVPQPITLTTNNKYTNKYRLFLDSFIVFNKLLLEGKRFYR